MRRFKCLCIFSPYRWTSNPSVRVVAVILFFVALLSTIFNGSPPNIKMIHNNVEKAQILFGSLFAEKAASNIIQKNAANIQNALEIKDWILPVLEPKNLSHEYINMGLNDSLIKAFVCDNCFHFDIDLLINPTSVCKDGVSLLILVHSRPSDQLMRDTIRNTWASKCDGKYIQCLFIFGNSGNVSQNIALREESIKYNDVIQYDFVESYENLTYKTVLTFQWVWHYCPSAGYVMKIDDDTFINMGLLVQLIPVLPKQLYGGLCKHPTFPSRTNVSKWFTPVEVYPYSHYPPHCLGSGYIVSMNLISRILRVAHHTPFFIWEDIYMGMIMQKLAIMPTRLKGFNAKPTKKMVPCMIYDRVITIHKRTRDDLSRLWTVSERCEQARNYMNNKRKLDEKMFKKNYNKAYKMSN